MSLSEVNKGLSGKQPTPSSIGAVAKAGDTMTGLLILSGDPSSSLGAVTKQYADALVTGLLDDRGNYDASGNTFPASGGSGTAGAILKGDIWNISVAGTLGGTAVSIGDWVRALVDTPGQTASNWAIVEGTDSNGNISANNFLAGYTTTATAAGTTTLTVSSTRLQYFTGSTTQTVTLPVTSTLKLGQQFVVVNLSSGVVTTQSSGANALQAQAANTMLIATCISLSGTGTASWNWVYLPVQAGITGTNNLVRSTSPTLVTPVLGAASATSLSFSSTSGIIGTTTNDNADAGSVGEYVSNSAVASAVSLSNNVAANATSISLTAGDWDVGGTLNYSPNAATTMSYLLGATNSTSATLPSLPDASRVGLNLTYNTGTTQEIGVPIKRYSLSGTTTIYLIAQAGFAVNTLTVGGFLWARRVR